MILLLCFVKLLNNILSCSNEHVPYFFFFLKDKHCYDEPDVIPALHFHYSHKPICGIDFMQIVSGICINKILINTSEETSVLFDTKASLNYHEKCKMPSGKSQQMDSDQETWRVYCSGPFVLLSCGGTIIK